MHSPDGFVAYKPLRNLLRKLGLGDSLFVIRAYLQNLQFDHPIPSECEVHRMYASGEKIERLRLVSEWHLETLCREIILHASVSMPGSESLKRWNTMGRAINKLKDFEEFISRDKQSSPDMILLELHRNAHRQFPWQMTRPNATYTMRYFTIYKDPPLEKIINQVIGLSVNEVFLAGLAVFGFFNDKIALFLPPRIDIQNLTDAALQRFLQHFSSGIDELRGLLKTEQQLNDRFPYEYTSLRSYPLIRMKYADRESLVCPMPTLLFWRFTAGVYYKICQVSGFADAYGNAFQNYVGSILHKGTSLPRTHVYAEEEYHVGRNLKRTVDWIVEQDDAILFIEAKTKRMIMEARVANISSAALTEEMNKMASMIAQLYKSIRDYKENLYPQCRFQPKSKIFPILVTLENWFIFGAKLPSILQHKVVEALKESDIPDVWIEEMPYTVLSIHELEDGIQLMETKGIKAVMQPKIDTEFRQWSFDPYLRNQFKPDIGKLRCLFQTEYDALVSNLTG